MFALFALFLVTFEGSCANAAYNRAYHEVIEREVDEYRHQGSVDQLRQDIDAYLASTGYIPVPGPGSRIETEWRTDGAEARRRVRVELLPHPAGFIARLFVVRQSLTPQQYAGHSLQRRSDFEGQLHEQLIPDASKRGDPAGFVYEREAQELWDEVTRLAFNLPETRTFFDPPPVDTVAASAWTVTESERSRLEVRFHRHGTGKYSVEVNERIERATGDRQWKTELDERDRQLELELIRHRDPLAVQQIETDAEAAGKAAYQDAIDHGAIACHCSS